MLGDSSAVATQATARAGDDECCCLLLSGIAITIFPSVRPVRSASRWSQGRRTTAAGALARDARAPLSARENRLATQTRRPISTPRLCHFALALGGCWRTLLLAPAHGERAAPTLDTPLAPERRGKSSNGWKIRRSFPGVFGAPQVICETGA